ncbi:beta-galactosidase, partial [bacterium]|nr:beta-galactosidase [bacterium]
MVLDFPNYSARRLSMLKPITNMFGFFVFLGLVFQAHSMDLSGEWAFRLDAANEGIENQWFNQNLSDTIRIPGSLQEQGFGNEPSFQTEWISGIGMELLDDPRFTEYTQAEDFQCPFWLTPERHYVGPAWYQKQVNIPPDWQGQRILLTLERPHWETRVWIDSHQVGRRDSLGVPH